MADITPSWVMTYDNLTSTVLQYLERSDQATINEMTRLVERGVKRSFEQLQKGRNQRWDQDYSEEEGGIE